MFYRCKPKTYIMSENEFSLSSKEYLFTLFPEKLRIEQLTKSSHTELREEYYIEHIIHLKSNYSYSEKRLLGAILVILGAFSALFSTQYSVGTNIFQGLALFLLVIGIVLVLLKSEKLKLILTLSNGIQNEYTMTIDNMKIYELMEKITENKNRKQIY